MNLLHLLTSLSVMSILVVFLLAVVSIYSWAVILAKRKQWQQAAAADEEFLQLYHGSTPTAQMKEKLKTLPASSLGVMFLQAESALDKIKAGSDKNSSLMAQHFKIFGLASVQRSLQQGRTQSLLRLGQGLSSLATIGAVSPFVGLFGTVWGIISAFQGLASGGASLDAVAPGIAEALVATAVGLFAAIPAVCFYNFYQRKLDQHEQFLETFSLEFLNVFERSLLGKM